MYIECCVCGKDLPNKITEAIDNALEGRKERWPTIGIVCDPCIETLKKDGIIS